MRRQKKVDQFEDHLYRDLVIIQVAGIVALIAFAVLLYLLHG